MWEATRSGLSGQYRRQRNQVRPLRDRHYSLYGVPEPLEVMRAAERGFTRSTDVAAYLGVTRAARRSAIPGGRAPASTSMAGHRMWEA
jgi:hypothetical protein